MKKTLQIFIAVSLLILMVGCSKNSQTSNKDDLNFQKEKTTEEATIIKVGLPKAPPSLAVLRMKENKSLGDNVEIDISIWDEPEALIAMVQGDEHDIFAFPLTVVSKLYNKGMDLKLMNVNTWGVTSFVTSDKNFNSWKDLKGKTVYVPLQSSPPDVLTQFFLSEAGLEVGKDVEIKYASMPEVAQLLISGEAEYATLIEPQVTKVLMKNPDVKVALSFEDEWQRVNNTDNMIPNAGIGAKGTFISENPEVVAKFQAEYEKALLWTLENPEESGLLAEKYLGLNDKLIEKSIPNMGLVYKSSLDAKDELSMFYNLLFDFDPKTIGGKIPNEGMYYQ